MKKNVIEINKVYSPRKPNARSTHRRVVAIHGGFVSYSDGGDVNKFCSEKSFRRAVVFTKDEK
jgi:hypothetical protein